MKPAPLPDYRSPIRYDFACRRCFYSLKGLAFDGAYPECGQAIFQSAAAVASEIDNLTCCRSTVMNYIPPSYSYASEIEIAAGVAQVPLGFLAFVIDTNLFVELAFHPPSVDERRDVPRDSTAETYVQALLHFASVYYG
ncbi:MAG: hypothetical protein AAF663_05460 [Planctomycetota bacterium]